MPAPTAADLIFSSEQANHNFSKTLGELKRSTLSIHNRLNSVLRDAEFAQRVATAYGRPLIANERCGSWYIDPSRKGGSAYFKSTDGHQSVWKFSSRRLNLHLLQIAGQHDGCIIVDSTRRGKRMPDALSKTIPIWCSVINRFLFPNEPEYHNLYTPPQAVSESENAQISVLLPSFVSALKDLKIQPDTFRKYISKPLRPIWVTPDSHITVVSTVFEDFHPIICCTVSRRVAGGEASEGGYIQGAGDDTENWAYGLTPTIFWENQQTLLSTSELELPDLIEMLIRRKASSGNPADRLTCVQPTSYLFITKHLPVTARPDKTGADTITIVLKPEVTGQSTWLTSPNRLDVGVGPHKIGPKNLRNALPFIIDFVKKSLFPQYPENEPPKNDLIRQFVRREEPREEDASPLGKDSPSEREDTPSPDRIPKPTGSSIAEADDQAGASFHTALSRQRDSQESDTKSFYTALTSSPADMTTDHPDKHIIIACESCTDLSIGVGLAIVCLFFDDEGELLSTDRVKKVMNKDFVRSRLAWFSTSMPEANPSRGTLQSVNSFLMDHRRI